MYVENRDNKKPYRARGSRGGRRRKGSQATQAQKTHHKKVNPLSNNNSYGFSESQIQMARAHSKSCNKPMNEHKPPITGRMPTYDAHQKVERSDHQQFQKLGNYHYDNSELGGPHFRPSYHKLSGPQLSRGSAGSVYEDHDYSSMPQPPPLVESSSSFSSHSSSSGPYTDSHCNDRYDCAGANDHELAFITTNKNFNQAGTQGNEFHRQHLSVEAYEECWGSFFSTSPRSFLLGRNAKNYH